MKKKLRKISHKGMKKKLDGLVRELCFLIARYRCQYCEEERGKIQLHPHHIYGRRNLSVRWDYRNLVALCANHHSFSIVFSAHQTSGDFEDWIDDERGKEWREQLRKRKNTPIYSMKMWQMEEIKVELEEMIVKFKQEAYDLCYK